MFPIINNECQNAYVINHININLARKKLKIFLKISKKTLKLVKIFKNLGLILSYSLIKKHKKQYIILYLYYYKNKIFSKTSRLISTPSKSFFISYAMLKLLNKKTGNSLYIISTIAGLITHKEALKLNIGGRLICFLQ